MKIAKPGNHGLDADRLYAIDTFLKERYLDSGKLPHVQLLHLMPSRRHMHLTSSSLHALGSRAVLSELTTLHSGTKRRRL